MSQYHAQTQVRDGLQANLFINLFFSGPLRKNKKTRVQMLAWLLGGGGVGVGGDKVVSAGKEEDKENVISM